MLYIYISSEEVYNEDTCKIEYTKPVELEFEHSLKSISLWEAKYKRPYLKDNDKTNYESLDYFAMMCVNYDLDADYVRNHPYIISELQEYIDDPHTATVIRSRNTSGRGMVMTSEVIYAYMANGNIPFSCDTWNIYNLLKVVEVVGSLNAPKEKMSHTEAMEEQARINAMNRERFNSKG